MSLVSQYSTLVLIWFNLQKLSPLLLWQPAEILLLLPSVENEALPHAQPAIWERQHLVGSRDVSQAVLQRLQQKSTLQVQRKGISPPFLLAKMWQERGDMF